MQTRLRERLRYLTVNNEKAPFRLADAKSRPPRWWSGEGVRLESGRSRVRIPLAPGFFRGRLFVCLLNVPFHTLVYFRDGSAQTILRAATLRQKLQIKAFHLTQSQYTDTGPTSPRADPITPGVWQGSHWNANV